MYTLFKFYCKINDIVKNLLFWLYRIYQLTIKYVYLLKQFNQITFYWKNHKKLNETEKVSKIVLFLCQNKKASIKKSRFFGRFDWKKILQINLCKKLYLPTKNKENVHLEIEKILHSKIKLSK